ncbi:MAG: hypothetical protein AseanaTS_24310 [Candidatus Pelagadaptatus aseana]|uniref:hypothetical protein n=1 Tax=Candidatus Pelagadaptatus aseana TaxID=3120508 RepID=UPI0039B35B17
MSALAFLILFIVLAIGSLAVVSYINEKEKRQKLVRQKLNQVKLRSNELEELVVAVDQLVETRAIPRLINEEIIEMLASVKDGNEQALFLQANYQTAIARHDILSDETKDKNYDRMMESDKQIAQSQRYLQEAARIIRKQQGTGKISLEEMNAFIEELAWSNLTIEAITYIGQGHKAINRNDVLSAHAFYKKAQQVLANSAHSNPQRHKIIKELSEMMSGRRKIVSVELMPETQYNPGGDGTTSFHIDNKLDDEEPHSEAEEVLPETQPADQSESRDDSAPTTDNSAT